LAQSLTERLRSPSHLPATFLSMGDPPMGYTQSVGADVEPGSSRQADAAEGLALSVGSAGAGTKTVRLIGELDLSTVPMLEQGLPPVIADCAGGDIVLDMRELTFLDSTGLRALWQARQHALDVKARLHLQAPSDPVRRVLRTTKLDKIFSVIDADARPPAAR
jgi:anti-sigma B factor antagonist